MAVKFPPKIKAEAIELIRDGLTDTEISKLLGMSTKTLYLWRKEYGLPASDGGPKSYTTDQFNDVIDLIREGNTIGQISSITGVHRRKIYEWHQEEIRNGNPLPDIQKGVSKTQKYSDEELIELAFQNPGYGIKRFISFLGVSEKNLFELFIEYKKFTNGEEDLIGHLQDERCGKMVTRQEFIETTGKKYPPKGSGLSTSRISGGEKGKLQKAIYLPPQEFVWGKYNRKHWRSEMKNKQLEWIEIRVVDKGYISAREDKDDFVSETGAGISKFNKWMKRADLIFDKISGRWYKP